MAVCIPCDGTGFSGGISFMTSLAPLPACPFCGGSGQEQDDKQQEAASSD